MRILVVGSGGREHALMWKLAQSEHADELFAAPGNPGMARLGTVVEVPATDIAGVADRAEELRADLTVVGPEAPIVGGLVDELGRRGLRAFGPSQAAAEIEGSKVFCRELARRYGVPMARGASFDDPDEATAYARTVAPPVVVKAEGLAAGKGVLICRTHEGAKEAIDGIMRERAFGDAGRRVVVEEHLEGRETTMLALVHGESLKVLEPAQDYKRALDGDEGLNTGGMGSYSPVPWLGDDVWRRAVREIVEPIARGLAEDGRPYVGCLYAGLMITDAGPRLIEVNARFGDPEIQVLLPRLDTDLVEALMACVDGRLDEIELAWSPDGCACVVLAADGYPGTYPTGLPLEGVAEAESLEGVQVFHAATRIEGGELVSVGGRVLNVTARGTTIAAARERAYEAVGRIRTQGMHYRRDIAAGA